MNNTIRTDFATQRAYSVPTHIAAAEWMTGVVRDELRHLLARRFAADNLLRKFSHADPFWLAMDEFMDALPTDQRYYPAA